MSDLLISTAVYETYFISRLYGDSYQSYKIDVGTFSKESFALEFAANKLKKSIVRIYNELPKFARHDNVSYEELNKIKELMEFLKEAYNSFKEDMSHREINDFVYKVAAEIKDKVAINSFSFFSIDKCIPFLHLFYTWEDRSVAERYVLVIEEKLIDQVPQEKTEEEELPDKL